MTTETIITAALPWITAAVLACLGVVVPLAYARGLAFLKAHQVNTTMYEAIGRAGGEAYNAWVANGKPTPGSPAFLAAAAAGGAYLQATVLGTMQEKGVTNPAQIAGAELGRLIAAKAGL